MGTRNLTAVMHEGKYKIAQYGQWDGYPDGQGCTAFAFAQKMDKGKKRKEFIEKLAKIRFVTPEETQAVLDHIGSKDGWVNMEQGQIFDSHFPYLSRDHGAKILNMVRKSEAEEILLKDSITFAAESLFCEWAYVIDLDKNTFEVYKGFQKTPLPKTDRFVNAVVNTEDDPRDDPFRTKYYPVRMVQSWPLDSLPKDKEAFLAVFQEDEEEDFDEEVDAIEA